MDTFSKSSVMKFSEEENAKLYAKNVAIKLKGDRIYGLEKVKQRCVVVDHKWSKSQHDAKSMQAKSYVLKERGNLIVNAFAYH